MRESADVVCLDQDGDPPLPLLTLLTAAGAEATRPGELRWESGGGGGGRPEVHVGPARATLILVDQREVQQT